VIDPSELVGKMIARRESTYTTEDSILYALGLGFGADPTDMDQLRFGYEQNIQTLPTMTLILGYLLARRNAAYGDLAGRHRCIIPEPGARTQCRGTE